MDGYEPPDPDDHLNHPEEDENASNFFGPSSSRQQVHVQSETQPVEELPPQELLPAQPKRLQTSAPKHNGQKAERLGLSAIIAAFGSKIPQVDIAAESPLPLSPVMGILSIDVARTNKQAAAHEKSSKVSMHARQEKASKARDASVRAFMAHESGVKKTAKAKAKHQVHIHDAVPSPKTLS
jgi:hypothetical protein